MTNRLHFRDAEKAIVIIDDKIYRATMSGDFIVSVSSSGDGSGGFRSYNRDRCSKLYGKIENLL